MNNYCILLETFQFYVILLQSITFAATNAHEFIYNHFFMPFYRSSSIIFILLNGFSALGHAFAMPGNTDKYEKKLK
jgi:hypothetical protein